MGLGLGLGLGLGVRVRIRVRRDWGRNRMRGPSEQLHFFGSDLTHTGISVKVRVRID